MEFYWEYTAHVWNDLDNVEEVRHGVTFAKDFATAAKNINAYYGEEMMSITMAPLDEEHVYEFEFNGDDKWGGELFKITVGDRKKWLKID